MSAKKVRLEMLLLFSGSGEMQPHTLPIMVRSEEAEQRKKIQKHSCPEEPHQIMGPTASDDLRVSEYRVLVLWLSNATVP